jgi:hypothetical protein
MKSERVREAKESAKGWRERVREGLADFRRAQNPRGVARLCYHNMQTKSGKRNPATLCVSLRSRISSAPW